MPNVRTTIQPGEIISISEIEFTDLNRQGLILEVVSEAVPVDSTATVMVTGTSETPAKKK